MSKPDRLDDAQEFIRLENLQGVPESMCGFCFHTMVAPSTEALETLEKSHACQQKSGSKQPSRPLWRGFASRLAS